MSEDLDWLEGGEATLSATDGVAAKFETVPVRDLTKRDLSAATGYPLKKLDALCRAGLPAKPGASKRGGLRFELPAVIEWLAEQRAAERAGPEDESLAGAKRRLANAQARRAELENQKREGELAESSVVLEWVENSYAAVRARLTSLETEIPGLSDDQQERVRDVIHDVLQGISEAAYRRAREHETAEAKLDSESQKQK